MKPFLKILLFLLFLVSGFCGLLYQLVWVRLAFASFGVITPVLSVVVSVFMAGLFAGSWASGRWISALARRSGQSAVLFYALAELCVASGAFAVPGLFRLGQSLLLPAGAADSAGYLARSALVIAAALFPWCAAMGATFPCMLAFLRERGWRDDGGFSFLYLANVCGALLGVALTAVALVESLGFRATLFLGAAANATVALAALALGLLGPRPRRGPREGRTLPARRAGAPGAAAGGPAFADSCLFFTGFASMAMEVVWTRAFTPVLSTQVYSFALVLFSYLLSTALGSALYRRDRALNRPTTARTLLEFLGPAALLPLALNDPRLHGGAPAALFSLVPFCMLLGYLTPMLVDVRGGGDPGRMGRAYALNILGCCLGPLAACYWLLPGLGVKGSLALLALPFPALLFLAPAPSGAPGKPGRPLPAVRGRLLLGAGAGALAALLCLAALRTYEDPLPGQGEPRELRRDSTATVVSYLSPVGKELLVNGIAITGPTTITKVMAHLPMATLGRTPGAALDICFGMGTTFRALVHWGGPVTAVELVPSVADAFGYYFSDGPRLLNRPGVAVVVDDGRRFLRRTDQVFDVVTVDPPPPVEAAASSLLYSEEFYALARTRMAPDGVLQQWIPDGDQVAQKAVARALLDSFPYVRMFPSFLGSGFHFLASGRPMPRLSGTELVARMPPAARVDLVEWVPGHSPEEVLDMSLTHEIDPRAFASDMGRGLTDDRPYNEYYLLRTMLPQAGWLLR